MGTLNEDLSAIKEVEDKIVANKVARFAYTDEAYTTNDANGVAEYNVNKEQNIPTADASVLKVNETVLSKGYRAQASSVTRMLLNHFFGRMSYNLNKVNDIVSNLITTLIGHRGTANGFATLDENGRIPFSQLPESSMEYKGQWNAETNTPALADGTGAKGDFYIVSVGGTQNLGSGNIQFSANDRIIYDGSVWVRLSAGAVQTVNNISPENGNVALTGENIPVSSTDSTLLSAPLTTKRIADNAVTNAKIADNAVTNAKIADNEVTNAKIADNAVTNAKIADNAVTNAKIADNAVTNEKIKEPISVDKGGTGATDAKNGFMNLANGLTQSQNPQDEEYMIYKTQGNWGLYTLLQFWGYIKGKISSVLGLTATNYDGTANKATNDGNGNNIANTYALKSDLQYTKSINIVKTDGNSGTCYYLIAETFGLNSSGNLDTFFVNGSDYQNRMFEGAITTRDENIVYNYGKDNLPIELYEQTNGDIYVYWLVSDAYNRVALNITTTEGIVIYGGNLSPVTPTGSKMTLTEYDYKPHPYSGMVHTCSTASGTKDKTVSVPGFTLTQGACIRVHFANGNSAQNPTLNVNGTGAKTIVSIFGPLDTIITSASDLTVKQGSGVCSWGLFAVLDLYYNDDHWMVIGDPIVKTFWDNTANLRKSISVIGNVQSSILK